MVLLVSLAAVLSCTKAQFAQDPGGYTDGSGTSDGTILWDADDDVATSADASEPPTDAPTTADVANVDAEAVDQTDSSDGPSNETDQDAPVALMPTVPGQIVVTELMNDPNVVSDAFGEWFEIYNPDETATFNLEGCEISDTANRHPIGKALFVPPKSFKTLAVQGKRGATLPFGVVFEPDYVYSGIKFGNSHADGVHVKCAGTIVAAFDYSVPATTMSSHSFSVDPSHYKDGENQTIGNWCPAVNVYDSDPQMLVKDYGTPGKSNPPCR